MSDSSASSCLCANSSRRETSTERSPESPYPVLEETNSGDFLEPSPISPRTAESSRSDFERTYKTRSLSTSGKSPVSDRSTTTSASSARALLLFTPSASIVSEVFLRPAVSVSLTGHPSMSSHSSIESRVVPATSDTIARFSRRSAFMSELLPAFGSPARTTRAPSRRILPSRTVDISAAMSRTILIALAPTPVK